MSANESFDGTITISTSKDHYAYIWKTNDEKKVLYQLVGHSDMVTSGEFIEDNLVVTASYDQTVNFWKLN